MIFELIINQSVSALPKIIPSSCIYGKRRGTGKGEQEREWTEMGGWKGDSRAGDGRRGKGKGRLQAFPTSYFTI